MIFSIIVKNDILPNMHFSIVVYQLVSLITFKVIYLSFLLLNKTLLSHEFYKDDRKYEDEYVYCHV